MQLRDWNFQDAGNLVKDAQRGIARSTLDLADVGPIHFGFQGKHFLRQTLCHAQFPHVPRQYLLSLLKSPCHDARLRGMRLSLHGISSTFTYSFRIVGTYGNGV